MTLSKSRRNGEEPPLVAIIADCGDV